MAYQSAVFDLDLGIKRKSPRKYNADGAPPPRPKSKNFREKEGEASGPEDKDAMEQPNGTEDRAST